MVILSILLTIISLELLNFRRPIQQKGNITKEFLESVKEIPSLSNVQKPEQAEDKCWRCEGEENVDKVRDLLS